MQRYCSMDDVVDATARVFIAAAVGGEATPTALFDVVKRIHEVAGTGE